MGRSRDRWVIAVLAALVVAVVVAGVAGSGKGKPAVTAAPASAPGGALPRQIAANLRDANRIVDEPLAGRLARLRGVPVVVNQWASWCPDCRSEFPLFQRLARRYRARVAFVGLDSKDGRGAAKAFLARYPVEYPSIFDRGAGQAAAIGGGRGWPTTVYYDRRGVRTFVHIGSYASEQSLDADIHRYAIGS